MIKVLAVAIFAGSAFLTASTADRWSATLNPVNGSHRAVLPFSMACAALVGRGC